MIFFEDISSVISFEIDPFIFKIPEIICNILFFGKCKNNGSIILLLLLSYNCDLVILNL